jgi:hypothetical protein
MYDPGAHRQSAIEVEVLVSVHANLPVHGVGWKDAAGQ